MENLNTAIKPLVSIIIPTYNRGTLIGETLESVLCQTYKNWECIIVDDKSTDHTPDIVNDYCNADNRFVLFERYREPKGAPTCRNIGLKESKGEYIVFLDSDDLLFHYALETRVNFLNKNLNFDFCISDGVRGKLPFDKNEEYYLISTYKSKDVLEHFFAFFPPWVIHCPTYRRERLLDNDIYWDESLKGFQDIDFHVKTIISGLKFEYISAVPDCFWRSHEKGNIGGKLNENHYGLEQKIYSYNKYSKNEWVEKKSISPLRSYLADMYLNNYLPKNDIHMVLNLIAGPAANPVALLNKVLLMLFRYSRINRIRFIPTICKRTLIFIGGKYFFYSKENKHFLKCTINMPEYF